MSLAKLWKAWRSFWFEPVSPLPLAVYRILLGVLIIQAAVLHTWPGFLFWYGNNGILSRETLIADSWGGLPRFDLILMLPYDNWWIIALFWLYVLTAVLFTIGLFTRNVTPLLALLMISFHNHNVYNLNSADSFERLSLIFMIFGHAGELLSVDSWLKKRRGFKPESQLYSPWAQRMIQFQVAIIYCDSSCCKLLGPQWLDGSAVYYATRLDEMVRFSLPFLFDNLWICKLLTWYTLLVECSMWTLVWFKRLRYIVLANAVVLHLGIDAALNLPVFEWLMIASLVNFVEPNDLSRAINATQASISSLTPTGWKARLKSL